MRQGQQNRRGRGRSNQSNTNQQQRKGQNPLTRSFESNGPDVKLRGTPAHIAEKYMSLARDALSSGDPVLAENHLQHAEHYNRIIMAYREQQVSQGGVDPGNGGYNGHSRDGGFGSDDGEEGYDAGGEPQMMVRPGGGDQPRGPEGGQSRFEDRGPRLHGDQPRQAPQGQRDRSFQEGRSSYGERRDRPDRDRVDRDRPERVDRAPERSDRDRPERSDRGPERSDRGPERTERLDRGDRPERFDRPDRAEHRPERTDRPDRDRLDRDRPERDRAERFDRPAPAPLPGADVRAEGAPLRRRERTGGDRLPQDASEQPEFLRRPVRRPRREDQDEGTDSAPPVVAATDDTGRE